MKAKKFLQFMGMAICMIAIAFATSCEGPVGPAGTNGTDGTNGLAGADGTPGVDGNVTCLSCHNTETKEAIASEFAGSQHSSGAIAVDYAGSRASCAQCHSHEGFLEFARTGAVAEDISNPSAWECSTCHAIHTDFAENDYAFRLGDDVTLMASPDVVIAGGNNNTCINCHQSRKAITAYDKETEDKTFTKKFTGDNIAVYTTAAVGPAGSITLIPGVAPAVDTLVVVFDVPVATHAYISSTHAGPHHGPQSNVWQGLGGVTTGDPFAAHAGGCVTCHMGPESGHSYWPVEGNCAVCHTTEDMLPGLSATAARIQAIGVALESIHAVHYSDGAFHPVYASLPRAEFNAWWDFMVLLEDRSDGAHNPVYYETLLTNMETVLGI